MKQKRATRCVLSFCFSIRVIRVDPWPKAFCSQKSSERNRSTQAEPPGPRSCGAGRLFRRHARRKALPRAPGDEVDPPPLRHRLQRDDRPGQGAARSEEHTSELQSLMRISYAVFCLKKKKKNN